jgi:hypothetical protein
MRVKYETVKNSNGVSEMSMRIDSPVPQTPWIRDANLKTRKGGRQAA